MCEDQQVCSESARRFRQIIHLWFNPGIPSNQVLTSLHVFARVRVLQFSGNSDDPYLQSQYDTKIMNVPDTTSS